MTVETAPSQIETKPCKCMGFGRCVPAPNRCRKPFKAFGMGFSACTPEQWKQATHEANALIGQAGYEIAWCLSNEPVLMELA